MAVSDTLRERTKEAIKNSTRYRVAKDCGIDWSTLDRFIQGGGLRLDLVDRLADYLDLALQPKKKPAKEK